MIAGGWGEVRQVGDLQRFSSCLPGRHLGKGRGKHDTVAKDVGGGLKLPVS